MKRLSILAQFICVTILLFSGCARGETSSAIASTTLSETDEITVSSTIETEPSSLSFSVSLEEFTHIIKPAQEVGRFVTYETPDFIVHREGSGSSGMLCFSSLGSKDIEAAFFLANARASQNSIPTQAAIEAQELLMSYCKDQSINYVEKVAEVNNTLVFMVAAADSDLVNMSLPLSVREYRSPDEFLADDQRREACKEMLLLCQYSELNDFISSFIDNNTVTDNDIVCELQEEVQMLCGLVSECEVETDTIERKATVYYRGLRNISNTTNIVPFLTTSEYGISNECNIGFQKNSWLFFDQLIVAGSAIETEKMSFSDFHRDVLGGSLIQEYVCTARLYSALAKSCENGDATIRFKNTDTNESIDHILTDTEMAAILHLNKIDSIHTSLYYSIIHWEDM